MYIRFENKEIKIWDENKTIPKGWVITTLEEWKLLEKNTGSVPNKEVFLEMNQIKKWFNSTDYIELQAVRGTISREDPKYVNYLSEYNSKLERYQELKK